MSKYHHYVNLGKGAALKTGMHYLSNHFKDLSGVVHADADGQHLVIDILRVAEELRAHSAALVLGSRDFPKGVPLRSRLGNIITRYVIRLLLGLKIRDTQTGLRGIPVELFPQILKIRTTVMILRQEC